ncbi:hypothetical protein PG996_006315 [Apiospora saccharicola]|uniref:Uncharacterized protein n=1 Tax=Apiospora saccharicola TaxID=335842 RepID=A0ABR1VQ18_9PEZI
MMSRSLETDPRLPTCNEPIVANFDSTSNESVTIRDNAEKSMEHHNISSPGGYQSSWYELNNMGHHQNLGSVLLPFELHIISTIVRSKGWAYQTEPPRHLNGLSRVLRPPEGIDQFPSTLASTLAMQSAKRDGITPSGIYPDNHAERNDNLQESPRFKWSDELHGRTMRGELGHSESQTASTVTQLLSGVGMESDSSSFQSGESRSISSPQARQQDHQFPQSTLGLLEKNDSASSDESYMGFHRSGLWDSSAPTTFTSLSSHGVTPHTGRQEQPGFEQGHGCSELRLEFLERQESVNRGHQYPRQLLQFIQELEYPQRQENYGISSTGASHSIRGKADVSLDVFGKSFRPIDVSSEFADDAEIVNEPDYSNEDVYPILEFPDDYWTYDDKAGNYYHMDREDGKETKVWYPEEFLKSHTHG